MPTTRLSQRPRPGWLWLLPAGLLVLALCAQQADATGLIILGNVCKVAIVGFEEVFAGFIERAGLEADLATVQQLCRLLAAYSLDGVVLRELEPQLRNLVELLGSPLLPLRLPEVAALVSQLADLINAATSLDG